MKRAFVLNILFLVFYKSVTRVLAAKYEITRLKVKDFFLKKTLDGPQVLQFVG